MESLIGQFSLQVYWRGDGSLEEFVLKCRNKPHMKAWEESIVKCVCDAQGNEGGLQ